MQPIPSQYILAEDYDIMCYLLRNYIYNFLRKLRPDSVHKDMP